MTICEPHHATLESSGHPDLSPIGTFPIAGRRSILQRQLTAECDEDCAFSACVQFGRH